MLWEVRGGSELHSGLIKETLHEGGREIHMGPRKSWDPVFPFWDLQCLADSLPLASADVCLLNKSRLCPVKIKEMWLRGKMQLSV